MDNTASELLALEKALLDPEVRRDRIRVSALLTDDFVEFGSSGRIWTRDEILVLLDREGASYTPPVVEDFECKTIANGVALVTYHAVRTDAISHQRATTLRSSLWVRISGKWMIRFHQGTRAS